MTLCDLDSINSGYSHENSSQNFDLASEDPLDFMKKSLVFLILKPSELQTHIRNSYFTDEILRIVIDSIQEISQRFQN